MEQMLSFCGFEDWLEFRSTSPLSADPVNFDRWGSQVAASGCIEPLTNKTINGSRIQVGSSWREGLVYEGINSRGRAVMRIIELIIAEQQLSSPRIYASEGLTAFALRMRSLFPRFIGSEFTLDPEHRRWMYPIPFEDLQRLSMATDTFDIVSTNEVLEHVPSVDKALGEICRVLRPGGWHVGTVPFNYFSQESTQRAKLSPTGDIVHILEPEYHGDPMNAGGVLVFETPGWDILDRALAAGFARAEMRFFVSLRYGIVSEHIGGVFVFCCQK